jgi:hypothetical protein
MIIAEAVVDVMELCDIIIIAAVYLILETVCLCKYKEELFALTFRSLLGALKSIGRELLENGPPFVCALVVGFPILFALLATMFAVHSVFLNPNPIGSIISGFCITMFLVAIIVVSSWLNKAKIVPWLSAQKDSSAQSSDDS